MTVSGILDDTHLQNDVYWSFFFPVEWTPAIDGILPVRKGSKTWLKKCTPSSLFIAWGPLLLIHIDWWYAIYGWCSFNQKEEGSINIILKMGIIQDTWNCQSVSLTFGFVFMTFHFIHIYKPDDESIQGFSMSLSKSKMYPIRDIVSNVYQNGQI